MIKIGVRGSIPDVGKYVEDVVQMVVDDFEDELIRNTPVDTGYAKSRWKKTRRGGKKSVLTNDAKYIEYLEKGSSKQAPKGITRPARRKIENNSRRGKYKLNKQRYKK